MTPNGMNWLLSMDVLPSLLPSMPRFLRMKIPPN